MAVLAERRRRPVSGDGVVESRGCRGTPARVWDNFVGLMKCCYKYVWT
jgi:hypothetical protein